MTQQGQGLGAGPMEIVDDHDGGTTLSDGGHDPFGGVEQPIALCLGIGAALAGGAGQQPVQLGNEHGHLGQLLRQRLPQLLRQGPHDLVQHLHPGLVGHGQPGVALPEQHLGAISVDVAGELEGQPGLTGTGLTADEHGSGLAPAHRAPGLGQLRTLLGPADEVEGVCGGNGGGAGHIQR